MVDEVGSLGNHAEGHRLASGDQWLLVLRTVLLQRAALPFQRRNWLNSLIKVMKSSSLLPGRWHIYAYGTLQDFLSYGLLNTF